MKKLKRQTLLCITAALACLAVSAAVLTAAVRVQADAAVFLAETTEKPSGELDETLVLYEPEEPSPAVSVRALPRTTEAMRRKCDAIMEAAKPEPEPEPEPACVYDAIPVSFADKELLAGTVKNEAGDEPFDGQVAVVQVALNRCLHPAFPNTVREVLCAPWQFVEGTTYEPRHMEAVEAALAGYDALDGRTDVVFFSTGCLRYGVPYKWICRHEFRTYR